MPSLTSIAMARHLVAVTLILTVALAPGAAVAGDEPLCSSTRAANDLISCQHCLTLKDLVTAANGGSIQISVNDLQHGAVVLISGQNPEDVETIHRLVDRLWETSAEVVSASSTYKFCGGCEKRHERLAAVMRDRAMTDDGAIVVLTAEDPELVSWLRRDAHAKSDLVHQASSD